MKSKILKVLKILLRVVDVFVLVLILVFLLRVCLITTSGPYGQIQIWYWVGKGKYHGGDIRLKHSVNKFSKLKMGMSPDEVVKLLGKPSTEGGDITKIYRYRIDTHWAILLTFWWDKLNEIEIIDYTSDRMFVLENKNDGFSP